MYIQDDAFERLLTLTHAERRPVRDQAALLLERALSEQAEAMGEKRANERHD